MKLVIPPECQIGAHKPQIVWSPKILDLKDARGGSEYEKDILIRLQPNRPITQSFQTLMHEALHQIDMMLIGSESKLVEVELQILAAGLAQFLLSLGIEPDFSQIPEEEL